jgi:cytochrome c oxidase subunit 3
MADSIEQVDHEPHGHHSDPHLAHHFDSPQQQFASGKLGMWVFLATEILMFGGLFCGYAVYRANHPEIFLYAHQYLDKYLGGINTVILLCSSFTMAWGVRAAQLGQKRLLVILMALTLLGGFGFMGIKYVEYKQKWTKGYLPGVHFNPKQYEKDEHAAAGDGAEVQQGAADASAEAAADNEPYQADEAAPSEEEVGVAEVSPEEMAEPGVLMEKSTIPTPPVGPTGLLEPDVAESAHAEHMERPEKTRLFFSWYFGMTGLHGIHVLVGMGLITWIMIRAARGEFGPKYFLPVDLVGLYWHLVDLIWIFLFPLLYLIH